MFENLSASSGPREHTFPPSLLSVACHAAVLIAGVIATRTAAVAIPARPTMPDPPYLHLPVPRTTVAPRTTGAATVSSAPRLTAIPVPSIVPISLPPIQPDAPDGAELQRLLRMPDHDPTTPRGTPLYGVPDDSVHPEMAVDEPVRRLSGPTPVYPAALRAGGIEGVVQLRMVVDTTGRVEPGSIEVRSSTHQAFEAAAAEALIGSRYAPARLRGRPVRQLVQQGVRFRLDK